MNRECWGDAFRVRGAPYYRCFRDGTVIPGKVATDENCPHCQRLAQVKEQGEVPTRLYAVLDLGNGQEVLAPLPKDEQP